MEGGVLRLGCGIIRRLLSFLGGVEGLMRRLLLGMESGMFSLKSGVCSRLDRIKRLVKLFVRRLLPSVK